MKPIISTSSSAAKPSLKVVLVEDKPGVRDSWVKLINSLPGFTCVQACASGEEAVRVIPMFFCRACPASNARRG